MSIGPEGNPEWGWISLHVQQLSQSTAALAAGIAAANRELALAREQLAAASTAAGEHVRLLSTNAAQISSRVQHGVEVFAPILGELTGELKRLRLEIHEGSQAADRSAQGLVRATKTLGWVTVALVLATAAMAWPMWSPRVAPPPVGVATPGL